MTSAADIIARTRRHLDGPDRRALALLGTTLTATGGETADITVTAGGDRIAEGNYLTLGLETVFVLTMPSSGAATVLRGQDGTVKRAHTVGDIIRINDQYPDAAIFDAINDELAALSAPSAGLFQVKTITRTVDSTLRGYDLADDMLEDRIVEARWQSSATQTKYWPRLDDVEVTSVVADTDFPSGRALFLNGHGAEPNRTLLISYKAGFDPLEALDDDVTTSTGLADSAHDILALGAAVRLTAGRPVARADYVNQGQTRRATEVSTADTINAPRNLIVLRQQRINEERSRLVARYGGVRQARR